MQLKSIDYMSTEQLKSAIEKNIKTIQEYFNFIIKVICSFSYFKKINYFKNIFQMRYCNKKKPEEHFFEFGELIIDASSKL
jgi:hypothetical protein